MELVLTAVRSRHTNYCAHEHTFTQNGLSKGPNGIPNPPCSPTTSADSMPADILH